MAKYAEVENGVVVTISFEQVDGWVEVGEGVFPGFLDNGDGTYAPPPAAAATVEDVTAERNRRLASGYSYDFGDVRGVHTFGTSEGDMRGWDEVTKGAQAAINLGVPDTPIDLVTETGPVTVTALEWQQILVAATAHRQPIWQSSFLLQAMSSIPSDFADDSYWP